MSFGRYCEEHEAEYQQRRNRYRGKDRRRNYGRDWEKFRAYYMARHPLCEIREKCNGAPAEELDHIVPINEGGARLDPSNVQSACKACHSWKTATIDSKWVRR